MRVGYLARMATRGAVQPEDQRRAASTVISQRPPCLNCGAALRGEFCDSCGQAAATRRVTFPGLLREIVGSILDVDSAALRTFRALVTHPGVFVRRYLLGERVGFWGPLRYYVLVVALNVGAGLVLGRPAVSPVRTEGADSFWAENLVALQISAAFALLLLPLAAAQRILHRRAGYTLAEHYAFLLYALAQSVLAVVLLKLLLWPLGRTFQGGPGECV